MEKFMDLLRTMGIRVSVDAISQLNYSVNSKKKI